MEDQKKPCCEFRHEDVDIACHETAEGYRIELTGDQDRIKDLKKSCCKEGGFSLFGSGCCK